MTSASVHHRLAASAENRPRRDVKRMKEITHTELANMGIDLRDVDQPIGTLRPAAP